MHCASLQLFPYWPFYCHAYLVCFNHQNPDLAINLLNTTKKALDGLQRRRSPEF
jgi:hypothetical protein